MNPTALICLGAIVVGGIVSVLAARQIGRDQRRRAAERAAQLAAESEAARARYAAYEPSFVELMQRIDAAKGRCLHFNDLKQLIHAPEDEHVFWAGRVLLVGSDSRSPTTRGLLVATDKHVLFKHDDERAKTWNKTWRSLLSWETMAGNSIRLDMSNARPKIFVLPDPTTLGPHYDARTVKRLMDYACADSTKSKKGTKG